LLDRDVDVDTAGEAPCLRLPRAELLVEGVDLIGDGLAAEDAVVALRLAGEAGAGVALALVLLFLLLDVGVGLLSHPELVALRA
jgi:hypothetical protein